MLNFTQKIINISHIKNIKINQKIQKGIKHTMLYAIQTENKRKEIKMSKTTFAESNLPETAEVTGNVEEIYNPENKDSIWFELKKGDEKFKIGLSDILSCLKFAERTGEIPKLPSEWWSIIEGLYPSNGNFYLD